MHIVRSTLAAEDILQLLTRDYGYPAEGAVCMLEYRGVNDVYRYSRGELSVFLKVYARPGVDSDAVAAEVEVVNHLRRSGLSVAGAIPLLDGRTVVQLETPEGPRPAALFAEAEGAPCDNDTLDDAQTAAIGQLFATLHTALDALPASLKRWRLDEATFLDPSLELLEAYSRFDPQLDLPFLRAVVGELKTRLREESGIWNWGLCHGDLYTGNIHRNSRGNLTLLDFDFCGYGWRAYDIASFLGIFGGGVPREIRSRSDILARRERRREAFLRGYEVAGRLSAAEIEAVTTIFVPFRRIFNMGYLYHVLLYVWGNRLRREQIHQDLRLLKEWVGYYW